jgi:hypothetical protein
MAHSYIGAKREIAFTKEVVRGDAAEYGVGDWQPHLGYSVKPVTEKIKDAPAMGRIEGPLGSSVIKKRSEGDIPLRLTKEFIGHIFNMLFGQEPTTTGAGPYNHKWTVKNDNNHVSYTITTKDPIKGFNKFPLNLANEIVLDLKTDDRALATIRVMGGAEESATPGVTTYSVTDEYFLPKHISVKFADTVAGLAAAVAEEMESATVTAAKNVAADYSLGFESPVNIYNQKLGVGIALTSHYEDSRLRDWANTNTNKAMEVKFEDGSGVVAKLTFPKVSFEAWTDTNDVTAQLKNSVAVFAELDLAEGLVTGEVTNGVASY